MGENPLITSSRGENPLTVHTVHTTNTYHKYCTLIGAQRLIRLREVQKIVSDTPPKDSNRLPYLGET